MENVCKIGAKTAEYQKEHRMQMYKDIIDYFQTKPDLVCRVMMSEGTWIFEYKLERKFP